MDVQNAGLFRYYDGIDRNSRDSSKRNIAMKRQAISATFWVAIEQLGVRGLGTIYMLIFARFLSAEDFGVFAAANLMMGLAATPSLFGLHVAVIQRPYLDVRILSTAFWLVMSFSIGFALILITFAVPIADLFGNDKVALVMPFIAAGMIISSANLIISAFLRRDLRMRELARRSLVANAVSGLVALPFIFHGLGYWGLVIQSVGGTVIGFMLTLSLFGCPVGFHYDRKAALEMLRFGMPIMGTDLLNYYSRESPKLFIGLLLGTEALGVFAMAMRVLNLILELVGVTLTKVVLPVMSQVNRATPERLAEIYLRIVHIASLIILPAFIPVIVLHESMVEVLLGLQWSEIGPIVAILGCAGIIITLSYLNESTLIATGHTKARFWFSTLRAFVTSILLIIATPYGIVAVGGSLLLVRIIIEPLQLLFLLQRLDVSLSAYIGQFREATLSAIALIAVAIGLASLLDQESPFLIFVIAGSASMLTYIFVVLITDRTILKELSETIFSSR